ncbi:MAG: DUF4184 family protein, partial [Actinomycetia bacterium]|nr:DUF4184 family protein [Actinomycetes bacterium]
MAAVPDRLGRHARGRTSSRLELGDQRTVVGLTVGQIRAMEDSVPMPVTFPAHQGLIAWTKLRWPSLIDGTAVCIGAAAPDFAYSFSHWMNVRSHTAVGLVLWAIPFTVVAAYVTRWRAAAGIFAHLPDLGPLRVRSYRVLGERRPGFVVTLASAVVGAGSHVLIDAFTHGGRWGADLLGLNAVLFTAPIRGDFTVARVGQYFAHVVGSLTFVVLLVMVARGGLLERWYRAERVEAVRAYEPGLAERVRFWSMVFIPTVAAVVVVGPFFDRSPVFLTITA